MNSILNSISSGDLQVQNVPRENPVKEDSIVNLLQDQEVEFEILEKPCKENNIPNIEIDLKNEFIEPSKDNISNIEIDFNILKQYVCDNCDDIILNTGFGADNDLHYETKCKLPELKTPLYAENFLREFITEEQKATARHSLGLYNKDDVVAMSLLTAEMGQPSQQDWTSALMLQLRKGDQFFIPYTHFNAVFDSSGNNLNTKFIELQQFINQEILNIKKVSNSDTITSLGDIQQFLKEFSNKDNLFNIIEDVKQDMIKFNKTGTI